MGSRRVLVTGGSRGIGRAIALKLGEDGWSVGIHFGHQEEAARSIQAELGAACFGIFQRDLAIPESVVGLLDDVGEIYALVNNAGIYVPGSFLNSTDADFMENFRRTFAVNFESPMLLSRAAAHRFANAGGGKILNVASRVGFRGEPGAAMYAASKAALINLTRSLAVELAPQNIGVFGIAPGWVDTAMARDGMDDRLQSILATIPLGRMASPEDCAAAASFLLSDGAAYLSGEVIDINGASYFH